MIRIIFSWIVFLVLTTIFGTWGLILCFVARGRVTRLAVRPWARLLLYSVRVKVHVKGLENIPEEPCVIMYNHQSIFDVFAYMAVVPVEWRAIMKKEVGRMPFIGRLCKLSGHHLVSRDGSSSDGKHVKQIAKNIRSGPSVILAPEGTRSPDGDLLPFQKGGFFIAMLAKVPVVTMVITGGREIRDRESRGINPADMHITIFPPIDVNDMPPGRKGREKLMSIVRGQMQGVLDKYNKSKSG